MRPTRNENASGARTLTTAAMAASRGGGQVGGAGYGLHGTGIIGGGALVDDATGIIGGTGLGRDAALP